MIKTKKALVFIVILFSFSFLHGAELNRRLIALYDKAGGDSEIINHIHAHLENSLNYYGYYCDYFDMQNPPEKTQKYAGIVVWLGGDLIEEPVKLVKWLAKQKKDGKKIIWIGSVPVRDKVKDYSTEVNEIIKKEFGFWFGGEYSSNPLAIKIVEKSDMFDFERKLNAFTIGSYTAISIDDKKKPLLTLALKGVENSLSPHVFMAEWGFYGDDGKLFFSDGNEKNKRWIANPYEIVKKALDTTYPIPDVTTVDGKRVAFIHVDGDGILSNSEAKQNATTGEVGYERVFSKYLFKTGVSFIAGELDKKLFGSAEALFWAKKILALPHVEAATHTYTHPLEWASGKVIYTLDKNALKTKHGELTVWQNSNKSIDDEFEIGASAKFIDSILPKGKKTESLYWSGDCLPTAKDLDFADKIGLSAINGGDSRFDLEFASLGFVKPLGRFVDGRRQIYTAMSNENIYTELWSDRFWGLRAVIESFENMEIPKRIKPLNLYYHHYSFEKKASLDALLKVYSYISSKKDSLHFLYPSEYIKKARDFYDVKISRESNGIYKVENAKYLKEFRLDGLFEIQNTKNVKSYKKDTRQNVTYITLGAELDAYFEVK